MIGLCLDCGINTLGKSGDFYMVHNHIWRTATAPDERKGYLCILCLEDRIGRELNADDFPDLPINHSIFPRSGRVKDRQKKRTLAVR